MKCKVLIVEDDRNFRYAIREMIPWEKNGFELVGEAIHGKQALEFLTDNEVDMILIDMEMPIMNGVELTRNVKQKYPHIMVVALSAYDDFEFVKESMKLGADDYLLKQDFEGEKVIQLLEQVKKKWFFKRKETLFDKEHQRELLEYIHNGGDVTNHNLAYFNNMIRMNNLFLIIVRNYDKDSELNFDANIVKDEELIYYLKTNETDLLFIYKIQESNSRSMMMEAVYELTKKLKYNIQGKIVIGYYDFPGTFDEIPCIYSKAESTLEYYKFFPDKTIFRYSEINQYEKKRERRYRYEISDINNLFTSKGDIELVINDLSHKLMEKLPEEDYINKNYLAVYRSFQKSLTKQYSDSELIAFYDEIKKLKTIEEKHNFILKQMDDDQRKYVVPYKGNNTEIIRALDYIHNNYAKELSLKNIAEYAGLSENYFSNLFNMELGKNITSYINQLRIEYAKQMLQTEPLKVYEIAQLVGYKNTTYFSTMFKKITGISISEYKNKKGECKIIN